MIGAKDQLAVTVFWDGAIVLDISVWRAGAVPEHLWQSPGDGWNALLQNRASSTDARLAAERIAVRRPEPPRVVVTGSYGFQVAAVCDGLRVFEDRSIAG